MNSEPKPDRPAPDMPPLNDESKPDKPKTDQPPPKREPVAWEASSVVAGKGTLTNKKTPRIRNRHGELLAEGRHDEHGRLLEEKGAGGRSPNFDDEAKADLITKLEPYVLRRRGELGQLPFRTDPTIKRIARDLVKAKGLESSDDIITRQLIDPVLRKLRPKRVQQNS
jgi:hypothetical protein